MTKKVGQRAPTGTIVEVQKGSYEILWDDGHRSIATSDGIIPLKKSK
ncbi:MAG: hypothetical protein KJN81_08280 [Acidimicrobiia bacterium]|nr:hypothetical protein [Acidimicrobiia bacterium]NNL28409.1 hypothetical protein [Acidimicrobiia bacterium]